MCVHVYIYIYIYIVSLISEDSCALLTASESPCQQICVNNINTDQAECKCEDGFELNPDGKTCDGEQLSLYNNINFDVMF